MINADFIAFFLLDSRKCSCKCSCGWKFWSRALSSREFWVAVKVSRDLATRSQHRLMTAWRANLSLSLLHILYIYYEATSCEPSRNPGFVSTQLATTRQTHDMTRLEFPTYRAYKNPISIFGLNLLSAWIISVPCGVSVSYIHYVFTILNVRFDNF